MQVISQTSVIASIIGGWEIVLILAVVLILFGAKRLPDLSRGLVGQWLRQFLRETMKLPEELGEEASDAGKSLGGIYGKRAYEALTPDNQTAEIYDPAILRDRQKPGWGAQNAGFLGWRRLYRRIWYFLSNLLNRKAA